jgi:hypothetical protein
MTCSWNRIQWINAFLLNIYDEHAVFKYFVMFRIQRSLFVLIVSLTLLLSCLLPMIISRIKIVTSTRRWCLTTFCCCLVNTWKSKKIKQRNEARQTIVIHRINRWTWQRSSQWWWQVNINPEEKKNPIISNLNDDYIRHSNDIWCLIVVYMLETKQEIC